MKYVNIICKLFVILYFIKERFVLKLIIKVSYITFFMMKSQIRDETLW